MRHLFLTQSDNPMVPTYDYLYRSKNMYQRAITQNFHGLPSSKLLVTIEYYRYGMNMKHSEKTQELFPTSNPHGNFHIYLPFPLEYLQKSQVVRVLGDLGPVLPSVAEIRGYGETLQDMVEKFKDAGMASHQTLGTPWGCHHETRDWNDWI